MAIPSMNFAQYINPGSPGPMIDITAPYRQWQQQNLAEDQLSEQKRQTDISAAHQTRVSDDINSRFAVQQGQQRSDRQYEVDATRFNQQRILLQKARTAAAEGRWNEVESMMGTLKSLGANVERTLGPDGRPSYRLQEGSAPGVTGDTYESVQDKIMKGRGNLPYERLEVNRFDNSLGTARELTRPDVQPNAAIDPQQQMPQSQPVEQQIAQLEQNVNSYENGGLPTAASQPVPARPVDSGYDPYALNTSELQKMNELRLNPLFKGLTGAFPSRYQGNAESLFRGVGALGASPEGTLEMLQKPLDTASRTWNAEMGSEGQMARAGMSQSGAASSEARMRENEAYRRAEQRAKDVGLRDAIDNNLEFDEIRKKINMRGNPNAQADAVKQLINLREGNRITDQDFQIGVTGYASDWQQAKERLTHIYTNGLSADQISNFNQMLETAKSANHNRIRSGFSKLKSYSQSFRYEPERYGVYNYIRGAIPEDMWDDDMRSWDPMEYAGGAMPRQESSQRRSVSATAPTPEQAVQAVDDLSEFE